MAYGQTSSGKTFTMKGNQLDQGIIPMTLRQLFYTIEEKNLVAENIIDLLSSTENFLQIRQDQRKNITLTGVNQISVVTVQQAMKLFQQGQSRRKFACNNLNLASSRSHAIFRINIQAVHENYSKTNSFINMVDLAGSEGVSRTKAEGNTKKQGENINKSILALSNVIRGMSQKWQYVNFRDSKLTRILQSSLLNNSKSIVICTINPLPQNYQQSMNTLKFGTYASEIRLQVKKNSTSSSATQRYQQSQARSTSGQALLPQQRIQFQQNKRAIAQLRQQNQQLRDYKRLLNQKIQFLQLQNHRLLRNVQRLEEQLKNKLIYSNSINELANQQKQEYDRKVQLLKEEMEIMADKYQVLNQYSGKLEKNQRYLLDRITKYENQISVLKQTAQNKQNTKKRQNTPAKPKPVLKQFKPNNDQQICPLTIGSIIVLKAQIIELKQTICHLNQQIANAVEERNSFLAEIQLFRDKQAKQRSESQQNGQSDAHKKQIRNLHMRIKGLKNQVQMGKNRQKKLTRLLKTASQTCIEQFDQFNQWYYKKKKQLDSIKKQKSGSSAKKVELKQNQDVNT